MTGLSQFSDTGKLLKSTSCSTKIIDSCHKKSEAALQNENGITRCNSVPFHRDNDPSLGKHYSTIDNRDLKIQLIPLQEKISELCRSRKISDLSSNTKESAAPSPKPDIPPEHKWNKLRAVMTMTSALKPKKPIDRQDSFIKKFTTQRYGNDDECSHDEETHNNEADNVEIERSKLLHKLIIDPQSGTMCIWLGIVTLAVLYNLWTCIVRQAFTEILIGFEMIWIFLDIFADIIYILDIILQLRTTYLERGLCVFSSSKLAQRYIRSRDFKIDILSLFPLDLLQFFIGFQPLLRFPRFLKIYRAWKWKIIVENRTIFPNLWRVVNLTHILFLGCHWFAAFYFMISQVGGFQSNWGYPRPIGDFASVTRKYLKSFYWSTLTLTTIGDLPPPERNWEYIFTIVSYLIGVFVFATIVGQVGNVITNRNANRLEFEKILDNAKNFMRVHNVPNDLQRRVMRWYDYAWSRGRTSGCSDISSLALLPDKLKTEMALHVNLDTLKKVTIFQECRPEFLHDLVLKMRPFIFTPGDLICRKGEVARELFIISDGVLEVISDSGDVLKKMGSGDFFGEIGILNLDGGVNRRTADVKSVGYSELFVLSKEDVLDALKDHPDAKELIIRYGTSRLNEMKDRRDQRITKRKTVQSSGNTSNISIAKSLNSFEDHTDENRAQEVQSISVFKTILNRMKSVRPSSTNICNHDNPMMPQSRSESRICDTCALANIANDINREKLVVSSFHPRDHELYSRLNSVPSIRDDSGLNILSWRNSKNVFPSDSLEAQNLNPSRPRLMSYTASSAKCQIAEEILPIDIVQGNQLHLNEFIASNTQTTPKDDLELRSQEPVAIHSNNGEIEELDIHSLNVNNTSSIAGSNFSTSEIKMLTSTIEMILLSQTNRMVNNLQEELNQMTTLCSYQQNEIDRLKEEIKILSSRTGFT